MILKTCPVPVPFFKPSDNWLGNYSPVKKISENGLWLVNELSKDKNTDVCSAKYKPLHDFLCNNISDNLTITFEEINNILFPNTLPSSAYSKKEWWANSYSHSQAKAWLLAGYKTADLKINQISFRKKTKD